MPIYPDQPLVPLDAGIADYLSRSNAYAAANGQPINLGVNEGVYSLGDLRTLGMPQVSYATTADGRRVPVYAGVRTGANGYSSPGDAGMGGGGYGGGSVARALPPTRQSLWNTVYGQTPDTYSNLYGRRTPGYTDAWAEGAWTHDPHSNPSLAPATEDDRMLAYDDMAHQLAQQVYKRGTADQAQRRVQMLQGLLNSGASPNLYGAPQNAQQADLQNFIQQDYNAGVRGWRFIPTADQVRRQQKENLALARQREQLGLDQAKFITSNRRNAQNDQFTQALDRARLAQTAGYENSNLALRRAELLQHGQEHDQSGQDALDREQALVDRQNQLEALQAVRSGMDPETASQRYGISGTGQEVLKSWGQLGTERGQDAADALNQTELALRQLNSDADHGGAVSGVPRGSGLFGSGLFASEGRAAQAPSDDRSLLSQLSPKQLAGLEATAAKNRLRYDPLLGFTPSNGGGSGNIDSEDPAVLAGLDSMGILGGSGDSVRGNLSSGNFGGAQQPDMGGPVPVRAEDGSLLVSNQAQLNAIPSGQVYRDAWTGKLYRKR